MKLNPMPRGVWSVDCPECPAPSGYALASVIWHKFMPFPVWPTYSDKQGGGKKAGHFVLKRDNSEE